MSGHEQIPKDGPVVMVCNHVSFVDWFVIAAGVKTPVRFVMHRSFYDLPVVKVLFRQAQVIPIASAKEDPELLARSFDRISEELRAGWSVCIFPEGAITRDGAMTPFRQGIEKIIARDPVPVVPMALVGLWGSFFSHRGAPAFTKPFRRGFWSRIELRIGPPVPPTEVTAESVQQKVSGLLGGAT